VEGTSKGLGSDAPFEATAEIVCQVLDGAAVAAAVVRLNGECVAANQRLCAAVGSGSSGGDVLGSSLLGGDDQGLAAALARVSLGDHASVDLDRLPFGSTRRGRFRVQIFPFRLGAMLCGATVTVEEVAAGGLPAAEIRFRALVESAADGIGVHRGGVLLYVNPAAVEMLGYASVTEVIGRPIMDFVHPDHHDRVRSHLAGLVHSGEAPIRQETFVRKDGTPVSVEVAASRAVLEDGVVTFVFFRDVTRRCQQQAEIDRAGRMESLSRFAGSVAHDFNNLLASIQGNLSIARLQIDQRSALIDALDSIQHEIGRAVDLTGQLLTFSRGADAEVTSLDPNRAVQESIDRFRKLHDDGVDLDTELGEDLGSVHMGPGQLQQVLVNLLCRAQEAVRGGGSIRVRTGLRSLSPRDAWPPERAGRWVVLAVEDTGVGLDAATRARLFEPFFCTHRGGQAVGLGLATAYGLIRQAGGWIEVAGEYGHGTRITIWLPHYEPSADSEVADRRSAAAPAGEMVLVCDDESRLAMLTAGLLDQYGYRAVTVSNCEEALAVLDGGEPHCDVVLLDVNLPDGTASAVLERMRERGHAQAVILTSGYAAEDVPRELMSDARVAGYLAKPYSVDRLVEAVRHVLDHPLAASLTTRSR
jgi:PAS domain S-box-containing protein